MSRIVLALVCVLALAGAALWFVTPARGPRGSRSPEATAHSAREEERAPTLAPASPPPVEPVPEESVARATPPAAAPTTREAAATTMEGELARAQWVAGRVLFPAGTPQDEEVFVTAHGKPFADGSDHRVEVERDGSFRVAFSEKSRMGHFELEARYLYLDEIVRWKSKESSGEVVLEPRLGARIAGRVRVPAGTDANQVGGEVQLHVNRETGNSSQREQVGQRALTKELSFAFDALVPGDGSERSYELDYDGKTFVGRNGKLVPEAGKTLTVELELRPGVTLAGVVRDASGAPLAGARLHANVQSSGSWTEANQRMQSAADGSFRLGALAPGKTSLRTQLDGFEPLERELGLLEGGTSVQDLALVLGHGQSIAGTVRWPDGTPAEATLELVPLRTSLAWNGRMNDVSGKSDASGAFAISGLSAESYRVTARGTKTEEVKVKSELTGRERAKKQRTQWSAEAPQVKAGTKDLVLTLSTGFTVAGRVVDERGAALSEFRIRANRVGSHTFRLDGDLAKSCRDSDGSFLMEGFVPGEWDLSVESADHAGSEPLRVTLPANEPVVLVLPREAKVSGRVLVPNGAPVARASVRAARELERRTLSAYGTGPDEYRTDDQGFFEIGKLGPGTVVLQASGPNHAPSEPQSVELTAGETVSGIILRLRSGGTILGELVGSDGRAQSGRRVSLDAPRFDGDPVTDADGRFQVTGVPPGEVSLWAETPEGIQLEQRVTVVEGETVHVRLAPPRGLVRLHGRVHAAGAPLASANLWASRAGEGDESSGSSSSETDEGGAYEIALPGSGRYWLMIHGRGASTLSWRATVEVPAVDAFEFDVSIPVGRISGRVTDSVGQALTGLLVESEPEQHEGDAHGSAQALTDAEGRYELLVPAGRHAVRAGGDRNGWLQEESQPYAEARVGGLVVSENGHLRGIDLVLAKGGILEGVVRKVDGSRGATRIWSENGAQVVELGWSDENGHFRLIGVAPGEHRIGARGRTCATREPVSVVIVAGETRRLELELVPAALVHLTVRENGMLVGSEISVLDERGRRQPVETGENGEAWLGPLIPGRYTIRAQRDARHAERVLELAAGQKEPEVELVFE